METILEGLLSTILQRPNQSYRRVPEGLRMALVLLDALQSVRHPRTPRAYSLIVEACLFCQRPNLAAEVYVGLVEEWIMEGRLAEGGTIEEHREGGGPAALDDSAARLRMLPNPLEMLGNHQMHLAAQHNTALLSRASSAARINGWFQGVRTWKFPGERLSPGEALDLWHPKKLAIHEKMLGFPLPIPTSPPSLVPEPQADLLDAIVNSFDVRSFHQDKQHYARYARALAILANTVLSRTLPITALPALIRAFDRLPASPPVYKTAQPQAKDALRPATTAYAHVRRALFSLVLSPPSRVSLQILSGAKYKLPPLAVESVHILLHHAVRSFRNAEVLTPLLGSLKRITTSTINAILRAATKARLNNFAEDLIGRMLNRSNHANAKPSDETLVEHSNGTSLQRADGELPRSSVAAIELEVLREPTIEGDQYPYDLAATADSQEDAAPERHVKHRAPAQDRSDGRVGRGEGPGSLPTSTAPDMRTVEAMLLHYTATSQFEKGKELLLQILPALGAPVSTSDLRGDSDMSAAARDTLRQAKGAWRADRIDALFVPAYVWPTALSMLVKSRDWTLAERAFDFAKRAETFCQSPNASPYHSLRDRKVAPWFMPIHAYTIMLEAYRQMWLSAGKRSEPSVVRRVAKSNIAQIYAEAVDTERPIAPDARFFNAYIQCLATFWRHPPVNPVHRTRDLRSRVGELDTVIADMARFAVPVPPGLPAQRELIRVELDRLAAEEVQPDKPRPVPITNKDYLVRVLQRNGPPETGTEAGTKMQGIA